MGIKLAVVGAGYFGRALIPLFKAHPLVDDIALCDQDVQKLESASLDFGIHNTYPSLDAVCDSNVDAVAIITQHWLHAAHAMQALHAGKHVFSAVPPALTVEEMSNLVRAVEETGRVYVLGETSYYYAWVIYCRQRYLAGDFGHVVYSEGEYYHDLEHGLLHVFQRRGGEQWRENSVIPPMFYATHSTSEIIAVTGGRMTHVSCNGFVDREDDDVFSADLNRWSNKFSNQTALFGMSDGSSCLINVFWRVGHPGGVRMTICGTQGSFEHSTGGAMWLSRDRTQLKPLGELTTPALVKPGLRRPSWIKPKMIKPEWIPDWLRPSRGVAINGGLFHDVTPIQPVERLPKEFAGLRNLGGEGGANYFIVDEFVRACALGEQPANDVWMAARYTLPGIVAHESARRNGELLSVPDLGDRSHSDSVARL